MTTPNDQTNNHAPPPSQDSESESESTKQIRTYFTGYPIELQTHPMKGRFCCASRPLTTGDLIFRSQSYAKGVHESYRKRVCDVCLKYNPLGRYEIKCTECHEVWYCSRACQERANGGQANESESTVTDSNNSVLPLPPLTPANYHSLDCSLLKKLTSCKLDKARIGIIRLLIRMYHKMRYERMYQPQQQQPQSQTECSSTPAVVADVQQLLSSPVYIPTYQDVSYLIGHPPSPITPGTTPNSHQFDWLDLRKYLQKISSTNPADTNYLNLDDIMELLGKVESNAFGFYAQKATTRLEPEEPSSTEAANDSTPQTATSTSSSSDQAVLPSKYVGVLIYPTASYFNHSCDSNVRVVQYGHQLTMFASKDIAAGEELCISYIDCNKPRTDRRSVITRITDN